MIKPAVTAVGLAWDPSTRDWTKEVRYVARDEAEARNWMKFNQSWMKDLRIEK